MGVSDGDSSDYDSSDCEWDDDYGRLDEPERRPPRAPSPGIAAVLSVFIPGLGHLYAGRLLAAAVWFLATTLAYSVILLPGFVFHAVCIWSAYRSC